MKQMTENVVAVGSKNPAKLTAVEHVLQMKQIIQVDAPSSVSAQPFTDRETKQGAINRAKYCVQEHDVHIGIGLEGGVMELEEQLYLCNWGALYTNTGALYVASGARIPLPEEISAALYKGIELGDVMDAYAKRQNVRKKEGAVGILTNDSVDRGEMFRHVVSLLYGQYLFKQNI